MYITQDRVILLDTQPLLSWALTDLYTQQQVSSAPGKWSIDDYAEMSSLQVELLFIPYHTPP